MKLNLKFLYFLTLAALCLYVTSGPATAFTFVGPPEIINTGVGDGTSTGDDNTQLNWTGVGWEESFGYTVHLDATATCQLLIAPDPSCAGALGFGFNVFTPGAITISLVGTSSDPFATGTATFDGITEPWSIVDGKVSMTPFTVSVPGSDGIYSGEFDITSLAPGKFVELPIDVQSGSPVPEPGSALLLGAGIALVEFLRRKIRG